MLWVPLIGTLHLFLMNISLVSREGEKNTRRGGWIVLAFSSFSPTEVTDQKQLKYSFWSDVQILDATDKTERKKEEGHKQLYRFVPQTGSSLVPLALSRKVYYNVISDYKCSLLNLARDFKCSSTTAKDFPCSWTQSRDFYAQAQLQKTSNQTKLQRKMFDVEHLIYNQWCLQYKSDTNS